jgi:hypothetical protein
MTKMKWLVAVAAFAFLTSGVFAQGVVIDQLITGRQIATANGTMTASPNRIAFFPTDGKKLVFSDVVSTSVRRVYLADTSVDPPKIDFLIDNNALKAKVDAVNGDAPPPTALTIASLRVTEDGQVIIASAGGGTEAEYIFRLNPETGDLALIAGRDAAPTFSSIEGMTDIAVQGRTVYVFIEEGFAGESKNQDSVVTVSVDAPDGGTTPAQVLVPRSTLEALQGLINPLASRVLGFLPNGHLVLANSAAGNASQDILEIDTTSGGVSILVTAADTRMDLGVASHGPTGGGVDPDGTIYLINEFGDTSIQNSVIVVRNAAGGAGDASLLASASTIIASPNIFDITNAPLTRVSIQRAGATSPGKGTIVFAEFNCRCIIRIRETP